VVKMSRYFKDWIEQKEQQDYINERLRENDKNE
jgi:hypothetical protein